MLLLFGQANFDALVEVNIMSISHVMVVRSAQAVCAERYETERGNGEGGGGRGMPFHFFLVYIRIRTGPMIQTRFAVSKVKSSASR